MERTYAEMETRSPGESIFSEKLSAFICVYPRFPPFNCRMRMNPAINLNDSSFAEAQGRIDGGA